MGSVTWGVVAGVVFDVSLWLTATCLGFLLAYNALGLKPFRRGFFCDDQSISYPYYSDTVSDELATLICIITPGLFMIVIEAAHVYDSKLQKSKGKSPPVMKYISTIYRTLGIFLMGGAGTFLTSEVLKLLGGRLRPHFLAVCEPDFSRIACSDGYIEIPDDVCQGTHLNRLIDARKSFPSGHAALAGYGIVYFLIYLQERFVWQRSRFLLPTLQFIAMCLGCWVSITRVSDNKHHWGDVVGGAILGLAGCFVTCRYMSLPNLKQKCVTTSETAKKTFPRIDPGKVCAITEKSSVYSAVAQ